KQKRIKNRIKQMRIETLVPKFLKTGVSVLKPLTTTELAKRIGRTKQHLFGLEKNLHQPSINCALKIIKVLNEIAGYEKYSLEDLFDTKEE
ncbi:TPA: hypothetical protein DCX16_01425, partial [bacterium]|nr:hypothetical protein [bacterium]